MQISEHTFYNCTVTLEDKSIYKVDANWLHNANHDNWQGWSCHAGVDRISIYPDGSVYSGECRNDYLGNINTSWDLLEKPTICNRARCTGCTDDLIITKEKNVV